MKRHLTPITLLLLLWFPGGCGPTYDADPVWPPEELADTTGYREVVAAADPLAVDAGLAILRAGGNAMDAAVAVQMALNVVEPPESGIGGGAFLLYRDGATGQMKVFDGRETAPASATPDRFLVGNWPLPVWAAIPTGLSVGVPGLLAMLHQAHGEHGSRPWEELFEPAIRLADEGFPMPVRLQRQITNDPSLWLFRDIRQNLVQPARDDEPQLQNTELAETLAAIAREGPDVFYRGELTGDMVRAARSRWPGRSDLTEEDFDAYRPVEREPLCRPYRDWTVCGIPAPSSGGITLLQILGILEHFDMYQFQPGDPAAIHLIAEASRLAFADREAWIGDPGFVDVPQEELLDSTYLALRASWVDTLQALEEADPGLPAGAVMDGWSSGSGYEIGGFEREVAGTGHEVARAESEVALPGAISTQKETTGTSHFSIIDRYGNAVAMTSSIEAPFGSRIGVGGFLLNNQLTDFTFVPVGNGFRSPNAVEPGKRPRSSMAPVMVFDADGELQLILGSRGGSRIIGYVVKTLIGVLDWELSLQDAIAMPNFLNRGRYLELEEGSAWANRAVVLRGMGHRVRVRPLESGLHGIERLERPHRLERSERSERSHRSERPDRPHRSERSDRPDRSESQRVFKWLGAADPRMGGSAHGLVD